VLDGGVHQVYGHQNISKVEGGKLNVVHRTEIKDGLTRPRPTICRCRSGVWL
jgi:branched-chain amino acid transport system substrate-binding protein